MTVQIITSVANNINSQTNQTDSQATSLARLQTDADDICMTNNCCLTAGRIMDIKNIVGNYKKIMGNILRILFGKT